MSPKEGDTVEITGVMDDPSPLAIGERGRVTHVLNAGSYMEQIVVHWESGRNLMLLSRDPFRVVPA